MFWRRENGGCESSSAISADSNPHPPDRRALQEQIRQRNLLAEYPPLPNQALPSHLHLLPAADPGEEDLRRITTADSINIKKRAAALMRPPLFVIYIHPYCFSQIPFLQASPAVAAEAYPCGLFQLIWTGRASQFLPYRDGVLPGYSRTRPHSGYSPGRR